VSTSKHRPAAPCRTHSIDQRLAGRKIDLRALAEPGAQLGDHLAELHPTAEGRRLLWCRAVGVLMRHLVRVPPDGVNLRQGAPERQTRGLRGLEQVRGRARHRQPGLLFELRLDGRQLGVEHRQLLLDALASEQRPAFLALGAAQGYLRVVQRRVHGRRVPAVGEAGCDGPIVALQQRVAVILRLIGRRYRLVAAREPLAQGRRLGL
jgi:hypothetical protein